MRLVLKESDKANLSEVYDKNSGEFVRAISLLNKRTGHAFKGELWAFPSVSVKGGITFATFIGGGKMPVTNFTVKRFSSPKGAIYQIVGASVDADFRRDKDKPDAKTGTQIYEAIADYAKSKGAKYFYSDTSLTDASGGFWKKQLEKGRAVFDKEKGLYVVELGTTEKADFHEE